MRLLRYLLAAALLLALAGGAQGQEQAALCPYTTTATGGGYYVVMVDDTVRSQHTREDRAVRQAVGWETGQPGRTVAVMHDYTLRVECDESWTQPVEPVPVPAPAPSDTTAIAITLDGRVLACGGVGCPDTLSVPAPGPGE